MNTYKAIIVVVVLLAVVGVGVWFFKDELGLPGITDEAVNQNNTDGDELNESASVNEDGVALAEGTFNVAISADGIKPDTFRVKKLQQLTINIKNEIADTASPFKFEKLPFDALVPAAGETSFTLVAPEQVGEYVFFSGDKKGVLIVEE